MFVTSTRAEYGLLKPFIIKLNTNERIKVKLVTTGTHLLKEHGNTYNEIIKDGLSIYKKINIFNNMVSRKTSSDVMSTAISKFSRFFEKSKPEYLVLLGDRFETLAIAIAAYNNKIPIIHLYGGETTEGALDEAFRHSITKLSYLHFTSTNEHRKRVVQLGESPDKVFNIGAIGIENIRNCDFFSKDELLELLKINLHKPFVIATYHPETLESISPEMQIKNLLDACLQFKDINFIFTKSNADDGGYVINKILEERVKVESNMFLFDSLGQKMYLSALKYAKFVIGNSSSGLIEVPSFKIPTINIGDRQKGRLHAKSVIDCENNVTCIVNAIKQSMSANYLKSLGNYVNPYGNGNTSEIFLSIISSYLNNEAPKLKKMFYDCDFVL